VAFYIKKGGNAGSQLVRLFYSFSSIYQRKRNSVIPACPESFFRTPQGIPVKRE
jgi:hypothetical protein